VGVAVGAVGVLAEGEQPLETGFAFGAVVQKLAVVEVLLARFGNHGEVGEIRHLRASGGPANSGGSVLWAAMVRQVG